jgi:hypothetical protein
MAARDPRVRSLSCRLAAEERHHPDGDHSALRRALRVAQAGARVRRLVDGLTLEERAQIAVTVLASSDGGA